jgi:uncharacterized DUF497 family protein
MIFTWDEKKNKDNIKNHGMDFEFASRIFLDPKRLEKFDIEHSTLDEERWNLIGSVGQFLILFVVYIEKNETIRLISARKAEPDEEAEYYENYDAR